MLIKRIFSYFLLLFFLFSCKKENTFDCFKSTGKNISVIRDLEDFRTIEVNDQINVTIYSGTEFKVEVVAGEHVIKNISTSVSNGTLQINNNNKCNFVRGYKREVNVNITVPNIEMVSNFGVGTIKFAEDFHQDTLVARITSSGDIYINGTFNEIRTSTHGDGDFYVSGTANSFYIYSNGTNYVRAENLVVKKATFVETLTLGDCFINGTGLEQFAYHIESNGNIYYTGEPASITNVGNSSDPGNGKAIKKE